MSPIFSTIALVFPITLILALALVNNFVPEMLDRLDSPQDPSQRRAQPSQSFPGLQNGRQDIDGNATADKPEQPADNGPEGWIESGHQLLTVYRFSSYKEVVLFLMATDDLLGQSALVDEIRITGSDIRIKVDTAAKGLEVAEALAHALNRARGTADQFVPAE